MLFNRLCYQIKECLQLIQQKDLNSQIKIFAMNNRFQLRGSSLKRSSVFNNVNNPLGRSFISTHLAQESLINGDDLRKSRIQNLPNYRKINLGQNPQFVIVFQTIQIQRLSNQVQVSILDESRQKQQKIQVLRVRLKQSQRLLFNAQNYEVQIRQLTEKCFNYEKELSEYRDEIENLNKICENLYHQNQTLKSKLNEIDMTLKQKYQTQKGKNTQLQQQIQKWKNRFYATEKSKAKQLQDLRNLMESQRKSMIDREIREMTIRFHNERAGLQNEIRKCRQLLQLKNIDVEQLRKKCSQQEINLTELKNHLNRISQLETKITLLSQQLVRLNGVLRNRQDTIQNYKKQQYELNLKLKQQAEWQHQCTQLQNLLQIKLKQIDEWKVRCSKFQQQATRGKELLHFNQQLTEKLQLSQKQTQRFNIVLKQKLQEIERWKQKLQQKQLENTRLKNIETQIPQYESKLSMLKAENQRINSILKSRLTQIQTLKKKYNDLENNLTKMALIEKEKVSIEERFNQQIKNHQELKFIHSKLQNDLNSYKKYQAKCRQLQNTNHGLMRESDRLNHVIKSQAQEMKDCRQKVIQLEYNLDLFKKTQDLIDDYENKTVLLSQEIQRLNGLIKAKNKDIDALEQEKLSLYTKVNGYKDYQLKISQNEQTVSKLEKNILVLQRDMQDWQGKFKSADNKIRELQNNLFVSNNERDKLTMTLRSKHNESQQFKSKYKSLQGDMRQLSQLRQICQQQHSQLILYSNDIQTHKRRLKQSQQEIIKQKSRNTQLTRKLSSTTNQLERISKQLQKANKDINTDVKRKAKQYDQLLQRFNQLLLKNTSTHNQLTLITNNCQNLQAQIRKLMEEFTRLLKEAQKSEHQTKTLYQKLNQYQDYAKKISILDVQLNRIQTQNKKLQKDNKQMRLKYSQQINAQKSTLQNNLIKILMATEIQALRQRLQQRQISRQEMKKSILQPVRKI